MYLLNSLKYNCILLVVMIGIDFVINMIFVLCLRNKRFILIYYNRFKRGLICSNPNQYFKYDVIAIIYVWYCKYIIYLYYILLVVNIGNILRIMKLQ